MNASELAQKMLAWEDARKSLDALEDEIKAAVLAIGKTQTVGNVTASYTNGRRTFDYETPAKIAPAEVVAAYTKTVVTTDWRAICKDIGAEPLVVAEGTPSVTVKLKE
jgi:hypothetical protein